VRNIRVATTIILTLFLGTYCVHALYESHPGDLHHALNQVNAKSWNYKQHGIDDQEFMNLFDWGFFNNVMRTNELMLRASLMETTKDKSLGLPNKPGDIYFVHSNGKSEIVMLSEKVLSQADTSPEINLGREYIEALKETQKIIDDIWGVPTDPFYSNRVIDRFTKRLDKINPNRRLLMESKLDKVDWGAFFPEEYLYQFDSTKILLPGLLKPIDLPESKSKKQFYKTNFDNKVHITFVFEPKLEKDPTKCIKTLLAEMHYTSKDVDIDAQHYEKHKFATAKWIENDSYYLLATKFTSEFTISIISTGTIFNSKDVLNVYLYCAIASFGDEVTQERINRAQKSALPF